MFGTAKRGKAPGVYFSNGGYISATGAIEINRDTAGACEVINWQGVCGAYHQQAICSVVSDIKFIFRNKVELSSK